MIYEADLAAIILNDPVRMNVLSIVRSLNLADGWIAAGFVRDAAWDKLHGRSPRQPFDDIDIIWFDKTKPEPDHDRNLETRLNEIYSDAIWSVKNQARMHRRNGDVPYADVADAMCHWPETATAVAVRLSAAGRIEVKAPFGLQDLFELRLKPTPHFSATKMAMFHQRVRTKRWLDRYPLLLLA